MMESRIFSKGLKMRLRYEKNVWENECGKWFRYTQVLAPPSNNTRLGQVSGISSFFDSSTIESEKGILGYDYCVERVL